MTVCERAIEAWMQAVLDEARGRRKVPDSELKRKFEKILKECKSGEDISVRLKLKT